MTVEENNGSQQEDKSHNQG